MTVIYILSILAIIGVVLYIISNNEGGDNTLEQIKPEENSDPVVEEKPAVVVEKSVAKKPAAKKTTTRKPAAKKPATKTTTTASKSKAAPKKTASKGRGRAVKK